MADDLKPTVTHKLGHGWLYHHYASAKGVEKLVLRNPEKDQRVELTDASVKTLRKIFQSHR